MKLVFFKMIVLTATLMTLITGTSLKTPAKTPRKMNVLMIGNSLTYSYNIRYNNSTTDHLKKLASKSGMSINIEYVVRDNETLENFADAKTQSGKKAEKAINSRKWDVIILQQQTGNAINKGKALKRAVKALKNKIIKKSPDSRLLLNCTWAYDKKKYGYTHAQQQKKMNANYKAVGKAIGADVSYSGKAFDYYRKNYGINDLYSRDKNHASSAGWYLNACCIYSMIYDRSPDVAYYGGLGKKNAKALQQSAGAIFKKEKEEKYSLEKAERNAEIVKRWKKLEKEKKINLI